MEKKKNEGVNTENLRFPILLMSLLFVGGLVLASFSYTTTSERNLSADSNENAVDISFLIEDKEIEKEIEPPKVNVIIPPGPAPIIIDSNTRIIPDPIVFVLPPVIIDSNTTVIIPEPVEFPDEDAFFPGGAAAMQKWIAENVNYPQTAIEGGDEGRVYLSFIVESDGSVTGVKVERGVSKVLDKEAKRVTQKMPNWTAGEVKGRKVRTRCRLPIIFELE